VQRLPHSDTCGPLPGAACRISTVALSAFRELKQWPRPAVCGRRKRRSDPQHGTRVDARHQHPPCPESTSGIDPTVFSASDFARSGALAGVSRRVLRATGQQELRADSRAVALLACADLHELPVI
jgi:hypothetical protein